MVEEKKECTSSQAESLSDNSDIFGHQSLNAPYFENEKKPMFGLTPEEMEEDEDWSEDV